MIMALHKTCHYDQLRQPGDWAGRRLRRRPASIKSEVAQRIKIT